MRHLQCSHNFDPHTSTKLGTEYTVWLLKILDKMICPSRAAIERNKS